MADILVIDDDEGFRGMVCTLLTKAGYEVIACDDGKKGVELYRGNPCSLVITDLIMPDQEGIETIMALHRDYPGVNIIAMSGGGRGNPEVYLHSAVCLGARRAFTKPFDTREFLAAVRELVVQPATGGTIRGQSSGELNAQAGTNNPI